LRDDNTLLEGQLNKMACMIINWKCCLTFCLTKKKMGDFEITKKVSIFTKTK